jgi:hypothetical protein
MGVVWIIRSEFHEVLKVRSSQSPDENKNPKALTAAQQSLLRILDGEPLFSFTRTSFDLQTVLRLGEEYGIKPTIVGGEEAFRVLDSLAASKLPMIYTGMTTGTMTGNERTELHWNTPGKLEAAGITYCLGGGRLLEQAQFAVRFGASEQSALAAITTTPAAILNVEDRVGRIKVGMDADFVALSGQPLDFTSACLWTMADGKMIFTLIDTEPVASESESTR